jgi:hypothetical protein
LFSTDKIIICSGFDCHLENFIQGNPHSEIKENSQESFLGFQLTFSVFIA